MDRRSTPPPWQTQFEPPRAAENRLSHQQPRKKKTQTHKPTFKKIIHRVIIFCIFPLIFSQKKSQRQRPFHSPPLWRPLGQKQRLEKIDRLKVVRFGLLGGVALVSDVPVVLEPFFKMKPIYHKLCVFFLFVFLVCPGCFFWLSLYDESKKIFFSVNRKLEVGSKRQSSHS